MMGEIHLHLLLTEKKFLYKKFNRIATEILHHCMNIEIFASSNSRASGDQLIKYVQSVEETVHTLDRSFTYTSIKSQISKLLHDVQLEDIFIPKLALYYSKIYIHAKVSKYSTNII